MIQRISIDLPPQFIAKVPWVVPSTEPVKTVLKAVNESVLGAVLVVDTDLGRPIFALTDNKDVAIQCFKKKKSKKRLKLCLRSAKQNVDRGIRVAYNLVYTPSSSGDCTCICLDDILETQSGDLGDW